MTRVLKAGCTANLLLAILVVFGYALCGSLSDLPIDQHFLGAGRQGRPSGPKISPWPITVVIELIILAAYPLIRRADWAMASHRLFCGFIGLIRIWMLIFLSITRYNPGGGNFVIPPFDHPLAWYVWCSHILYCLIGPNDD